MSGFVLIEDRVLGAAAPSVVFNTGLTDFTRFRLTVFVVKDGTNGALQLRFNGDSGANYASQLVAASASSPSGSRSTGATVFAPLSGVMAANTPTFVTLDIQKPQASDPARITNEGAWGSDITYVAKVGEWNNTADLISSITILSAAGNFAAGTRIVLEGAPGTAPVLDSAVRLVVDGVIEDDDYSSEEPWPDEYATANLGPIDISAVPVADLNAADFGAAISATVPDDNIADVDAVPMEVAYDVAVDVALTSHTDTLERPNDTLEWTATVGGDAITQASYRVVGRLQPGNTIVYDSGVIASATQEHQIGSGTPVVAWASPQDGQVVRWTVTVTEDGTADPDGVGDNISGSEAVDLTNDWTLPTAPSGLAAVAVTEAP